MKKHLLIICGLFLCTSISGQSENSSLTYHVELGALPETVRTPHCGSLETVTD